MHNSSTCPICCGLPVGGAMSDDEFFAFLAACRDELAAKQAGFQRRIAGASRWHYEMADGSLTIGDTRFGMTPIGTFSPEYQSWLWAWANEDFPPVARAASRQIQGLHAVTGFRVFLDPGIRASPADGQDFAALAVHQLGAIGFFRCPSDGPVLYLAAHEPGSQDAAPGTDRRRGAAPYQPGVCRRARRTPGAGALVVHLILFPSGPHPALPVPAPLPPLRPPPSSSPRPQLFRTTR